MLIISGCKLENRFDEMATVRNMCRDVYGFQLDSKMELLSWGANTYSQLGQGFKSEQCVLPGKIKKEDSLDPSCITCIAGGGGHTLIVNKHGKVFACGSNTKGQLGLGMDTEHLVFEEVKSLGTYHVTKVSCGWDFSLAVTKDGELLVWGSNAYCQLGLPKKKVPFTTIPLKLAVPHVRTVASGLRHSAVVTRDGRVLVCGNGKNGQLGLTDRNGIPVVEVEQAQEVPGMTDVCSVACGQQHTVVITFSGRIFVWGSNKHGQLGVDPSLHSAVFMPKEICLPQRPDAGCILLSGWTHTAILTDDGKIINWGRNTYGQLGCHEYQRSLSWKPQIMDNIGNVTQLAVGSEHNVAVLGTGRIVSWGWNEHGNCGTGTQEDVRVPTSVEMSIMQKALFVGTGAGHSFALSF